MTITDSLCDAAPMVSRTLVTSRINRTLTLQGVLCALTESAMQQVIAFDECCLILCPSRADESRFAVWIASPAAGLHNAMPHLIAAAPPKIAQALQTNSTRTLNHIELRQQVNQPLTSNPHAADSKTAVIVPLSTDDEAFGALVFMSASEIYTETNLLEAQWLINHIAVAVQASLLREQLRHRQSDVDSTCDNLKRAFMHTLVRDVRLPLTGVLNFLQSCEAKLKNHQPFTDSDRCLLSSALDHSREICATIDNHAELANADVRPLTLVQKPVAPRQIIERAIECVHAEAALRGIELLVHRAANLPRIVADERQAARAVAHLLAVALTATNDGGCICIEAARADNEAQNFVRINVAHSNVANEETVAPCESIWSSSNVQHFADANIQLAIACRIAQAHGGTLEANTHDEIEIVYSLALPACIEG